MMVIDAYYEKFSVFKAIASGQCINVTKRDSAYKETVNYE